MGKIQHLPPLLGLLFCLLFLKMSIRQQKSILAQIPQHIFQDKQQGDSIGEERHFPPLSSDQLNQAEADKAEGNSI